MDKTLKSEKESNDSDNFKKMYYVIFDGNITTPGRYSNRCHATIECHHPQK